MAFLKFQSVFEPPASQMSHNETPSEAVNLTGEKLQASQNQLQQDLDFEKREKDILSKIYKNQQTLYEELLLNRFRKFNQLHGNSVNTSPKFQEILNNQLLVMPSADTHSSLLMARQILGQSVEQELQLQPEDAVKQQTSASNELLQQQHLDEVLK